MAMRLGDLTTWRGNMGRGDYARWGFTLFAVKYSLDRLLLVLVFGQTWYPWNYLLGPRTAMVPSAAGHGFLPFGCLLALSVPFIACGLAMTLRRLRDAGWSLWLVALFFVPFVNLLFFAFLCLQPSREPPPSSGMPTPWWQRALATEKTWAAAALAVGAGVLLGSALLVFGTVFLRDYGWGLFVGTPFMMGFFGALFYSVARVRTWGECALVALAAVLLTAGLLLVLAVEGLFCIAMAAPIGLGLAVLGATVGWALQLERWSRQVDRLRLYAAAWVLAPLLLATERQMPAQPPLFAATTVCEIAASPAVVWQNVVAFSELAPPRETLFKLGIAYPVRARLEGQGVGAVRHCEFSTGPFVEPITVWEENRRLAFDVIAQPHPMREWSPYATLEPAHLEGFFRSRRGEFRLVELPGGRTRLEGTTWYEQAIWPQAYWRPWADHLIHTIHRRVLEHIKTEAEAKASGRGP